MAAWVCARAGCAGDVRRVLANGFVLQAAALVAVAVPVAMAGIWVAVGWGVLALTFAVAARWLELPAAAFAGPVVWMLAVIDLALWANGVIEPGIARHTLLIAGHHIPVAMLFAWLLALCGYAIAAITQPSVRAPTFGAILTVEATILFVIATIVSLPPIGSTLALIAAAWLLAAVQRPDYLKQSIGLLALASFLWIFSDILAQRLDPAWKPSTAWPLLSSIMGETIAVAGSVWGIYRFRRSSINRIFETVQDETGLRRYIALIVTLIFTLGLTFEIDRLVALHAATTFLGVPAWQWRNLLWTSTWTSGTVGYLLAVHWISPREHVRQPRSITRGTRFSAALVLKWLIADTLFFRFIQLPVPAPVVANPVGLSAAFLIAAMVVLYWLTSCLESSAATSVPSWVRKTCVGAGLLVALWFGSLQIDQAFIDLHSSGLAEQAALSIFWSIFAVLTVAGGFVYRAAPLRYFGLGLLALTLLKVVTIDLSQVGTGYRVLSFMGLGVLMLGTSVLYGKVASEMTRANAREIPASE